MLTLGPFGVRNTLLSWLSVSLTPAYQGFALLSEAVPGSAPGVLLCGPVAPVPLRGAGVGSDEGGDALAPDESLDVPPPESVLCADATAAAMPNSAAAARATSVGEGFNIFEF